MRSKVAQRILDNTSEDVKIYTRHYGDLMVRIHSILTERGYTQKQLADMMGKKPSEISKWLSGEHNFTLKSISKLEAELGESLIEVPKPISTKVFHSTNKTTTFKIYKNVARIEMNRGNTWRKTELLTTESLLSHVG